MAPRVRPTVHPVTGSLKRWPREAPETTRRPKREAPAAGRAAAPGLATPGGGGATDGRTGGVDRGVRTGAAGRATGMPPAVATGGGVRLEGLIPGGPEAGRGGAPPRRAPRPP